MLRPAVEILRPHNMLVAALGVVAGHHVAGGAGASVIPVAALTALATGAGNAINDYFDLAIDRVNKPGRPLPSGRLSPRTALVLYAFLTLLVTGGAVGLLDARVAAVVLAWEAGLFAYAAGLKKRFFAGNLLVATISASAFVAGALTAGNARAAAIPAAIAFAFVACREVVKGGEDVEGDAAAGVHTAATRLGRERTARVVAVAMLAVASALPAPSLAGSYGPAYALAMMATVTPALILGAVVLVRTPVRASFARTRRLLKLAMFTGIAAIALAV